MQSNLPRCLEIRDLCGIFPPGRSSMWQHQQSCQHAKQSNTKQDFSAHQPEPSHHADLCPAATSEMWPRQKSSQPQLATLGALRQQNLRSSQWHGSGLEQKFPVIGGKFSRLAVAQWCPWWVEVEESRNRLQTITRSLKPPGELRPRVCLVLLLHLPSLLFRLLSSCNIC